MLIIIISPKKVTFYIDTFLLYLFAPVLTPAS